MGAPPTRGNYSWGKFFLGEIFFKIGGKYEIERKRKKERHEGEDRKLVKPLPKI